MRMRQNRGRFFRRSARGRLAEAGGFSLVEMLVATTIVLVTMAGVFTVLNPSQGTFQAQPEVADMQQRLRVAVDTLQKDLVMSGAGTYSGIVLGTLLNYFAPVVPYRMGTIDADPPGSFRTDAITLMYIVPSAAQTTIRSDMPQPSAELKVDAQPGCPVDDALCGFEEGMTVVIFDDSGTWDPFTITEVQADSLHLQHRGQDLSKAYPTGSYIAQLAAHTYYLKTDPTTDTYELRHYDGYQNDLPVVDNVIGLEFEYFGESQPPRLRRPVSDPVGPWTTYGPKPPALGVVPVSSGYAAGENCVFTLVDGQQVSRLPELVPGSNGLVKLDPQMLTDGPWCPSATAPFRFDADLLRIRRVRVTLRVQAPAMLRGPAGLGDGRWANARGGLARTVERQVPDQEIQFDVTPRNLNLGR